MYKQNKPGKTSIKRNTAYEGECIEKKVYRLFQNGEAIGDDAPLIYTERKDGVLPEYNIRADRFDIALEAMDKGSRSYRATREERHKPKEEQKTDNKDTTTDTTTNTGTKTEGGNKDSK